MIDYIKIIISDVVLNEEVFKKLGSPSSTKRVKIFSENAIREGESFLLVMVNQEKKEVHVQGSIRKWRHIKNNAVFDLTKSKFVECINEISKILGVPTKKIFNSVITKLEIGANLKLNVKYKNILSCIDDYPQLKKETYQLITPSEINKIRTNEIQTLYFMGVNYSLIFYDKLEEIYKEKENKKTLKKLKENISIYRYEITINKVSGFVLKDKINTAKKISDNWNEIIDFWVNQIDKITFIDNISFEEIHYKKNMGKTEIKELLIYQGMRKIGKKALRVLLKECAVKEKLSPEKSLRNDFKRIWENHQGKKFRSYEDVFKTAIIERGECLKC